MDPLVVASGFGKLVDPGLIDLYPLTMAKVVSDRCSEVIRTVKDGGHGRRHYARSSRHADPGLGGLTRLKRNHDGSIWRNEGCLGRLDRQ